MVAKRRLDFSTPTAVKRNKNASTMVVYRSPRTEMKYFDTTLPYAGVNFAVAAINLIGAGAALSNPLSGRVGNKVKIHRVQAIIAETSSSGPVRVDLLLPKIPTAIPSFSYSGLVDPAEVATLYSKYLHNGTNFAATGAHINHKLPLGIVSHFDGQLGTTIQRNSLWIAVATPANETITINCRVWFTDA